MARKGLLLLHSLGTDTTMWAPQLDAFTSIRRVVSIGLPGHGESTARPGEYRLDDLGQDMLDIADAAGLHRFDVCGISLGGLIGLWLALNAPDRILTLVASNTAARVGSPALWSERIRVVSMDGMEGIRGDVVPRFLTTDFPERHPEAFRAVEEMFISVDPIGYIGCCAVLRDADLREAISGITCPTLILGGDQDTATPPAEAVRLHRHIRGSRIEIIPGAAHLANLDRPEIFTKLVMAGLEKV